MLVAEFLAAGVRRRMAAVKSAIRESGDKRLADQLDLLTFDGTRVAYGGGAFTIRVGPHDFTELREMYAGKLRPFLLSSAPQFAAMLDRFLSFDESNGLIGYAGGSFRLRIR